ncbi:MAG: L,D-transpeptidase, partial [Clostridiaceae bacterium]|nr:L,D-transpeptidase [Clostridiaceae bacterium]
MKLKFSTLVIITLVLIVAIVAAAKIGSPDHQGYTEEQETKNSEGNTTSNHIENIETTTSAQKVTESTVVKEETEPKTSIPVTVPQTNVEQILKDGNFNYYIYIELGSGTLTIYEKSGAESFDKVIHCSPVSAGLGGSTPVGIFHIKERKDWLEMESDGYVQYATLWDRGVIISSSLYETQDRNTLVRKSYLGLGQPSTKGNILTTAGTAYWIMQNSSENTLLHIVEGSPKQIVSDPLPELNPEYVFTDPTDPLYRTLEELEKEGELPYSLYLEKGSFTLTVYKKDENGEYTVPVKAFRTAVGRTAGRTPVGNFAVYKKERWHEFPYNGGYAQ